MNSSRNCILNNQRERSNSLTDYTLIDTNHFKIRVNESIIISKKKIIPIN